MADMAPPGSGLDRGEQLCIYLRTNLHGYRPDDKKREYDRRKNGYKY